MTRRQKQIIIPSGRPPFDLTPSLFKGAEDLPKEAGEPVSDLSLYEAMQQGHETGLSDGSDALGQALTDAPEPPAKGTKARKKAEVSSKAEWEPAHFSDADLISWAQKCRESHQDYLKVSALKYWLRYTFESYTPEYKELGERLEKVVQ